MLQTLLEKLEQIRKDLGQSKVFDVVGRLLDGKSLGAYMEDVLQGRAADATRDVDEKITRQRVEDIPARGLSRFMAPRAT